MLKHSEKIELALIHSAMVLVLVLVGIMAVSMPSEKQTRENIIKILAR